MQTMTTWLRLAAQLLIRSSCVSTEHFIILELDCDVDVDDGGKNPKLVVLLIN